MQYLKFFLAFVKFLFFLFNMFIFIYKNDFVDLKTKY